MIKFSRRGASGPADGLFLLLTFLVFGIALFHMVSFVDTLQETSFPAATLVSEAMFAQSSGEALILLWAADEGVGDAAELKRTLQKRAGAYDLGLASVVVEHLAGGDFTVSASDEGFVVLIPGVEFVAASGVNSLTRVVDVEVRVSG